jgi:hypothetical protein
MATPSSAALGTHGTPPSADLGLVGIVATAKVGAKAVAPGRAMRVPAATTFAQLRGEVLDGMAADQAAQVRSLPAVATAFRSAQHVSNEQVEARLSDEVGASVALGYKHIVLSHTPRATAPAPAPAGNAHAVLMGAANTPVQLPDLYTCGEDSELTYEYELLLVRRARGCLESCLYSGDSPVYAFTLFGGQARSEGGGRAQPQIRSEPAVGRHSFARGGRANMHKACGHGPTACLAIT